MRTQRQGQLQEALRACPGPGAGRQAGSSFKAFALAAAIEEGVPLSKVFDVSGSSVTIPGADNGADYTVQNYEGSSYGKMSLLEATVKSVNVIYALLGQEIGVHNVTETAADMGIRTPLADVASAPLGTNSINPLDMASAYGTLATNGKHHPPVAITRIVDKAGRTIYREEAEPVQALEPAVAYLTTTALEQVMIRGTGTGAQIGRPAAGKTGTAQEYRDAWFVGYTPDLVTSVWVGYPEGQIEMKTSCFVELCRPTRIQVTGGSWPADIWQRVHERGSRRRARKFLHQPRRRGDLRDRHPDRLSRDRGHPEGVRRRRAVRDGRRPTRRIAGEDVEVPDVFGFPQADAIAIMEDAGFEVDIVRVASNTYPPGRVVGQSPAAGESAAAGSTVTLEVSGGDEASSTGPERPGSVTRRGRGAAPRGRLPVATVIEAEPDKKQAKKRRGQVWKQSPASGTERRERLDRNDLGESRLTRFLSKNPRADLYDSCTGKCPSEFPVQISRG